MKPKRQAGEGRRRSSAEETRRLIEAATKQPGVAELLRVYQTWQQFEQVSEVHSRFTAARQIVSTSSSSAPAPCEPA